MPHCSYLEGFFSDDQTLENERNRLDVERVKAELLVFVNLTGKFKNMYFEFLKNKELLKEARDGQKYRHK